MEVSDIDRLVNKIKESKDAESLNGFIKDFLPFIIKTVSDSKNSYVEIENDEEFSIGLIAFNEAIEKYNITKGPFLPFAKMVIISRLNNHYQKENKNKHLPIEEIIETGVYSDNDLALEIDEFEKELLKFGMDFEFLVENTPKHKDTRYKAFETGEKIYEEEDLVELTFNKKKLPMKKIAERFFISVKFLKGSKYIIIAVLIVLKKDFSQIYQWIKK